MKDFNPSSMSNVEIAQHWLPEIREHVPALVPFIESIIAHGRDDIDTTIRLRAYLDLFREHCQSMQLRLYEEVARAAAP